MLVGSSRHRRLQAALGCLGAAALLIGLAPPLRGQEKLAAYYARWLSQDVFYITTEEEYDVFRKLTSDDERDQFIEQFWLRRDPDPTTSDNEFKLEHYRRILYANEKFTAGISGWKTDRGRIYIQFGPPDRVESTPAGGSYARPRKEGGGHTSVYPFEVWEYRRIEGVGEDIELEFVDDRGGGLYELTFDNQRKDELINSGFMGPTLDEIEEFERTGLRRKRFRVVGRRFAGDLPAPYRDTGGFETHKDQPFNKLTLAANLNRPTAIRFKDLEAVVASTIRYDLIPFQAEAPVLKISDSQSLVTVSVRIPQSVLTFKEHDGLRSARVEVFGQASTPAHRVEAVFEEEIARDVPAERFAIEQRAVSIFQKHVFLRPGLYKFNLVIKDKESGRIGTWEQRVEVPRHDAGRLALSSVILAQDLRTASQDGDGRFEIGALKVVPRVSSTFRRNESLGFYFQIYQAAVDPTTSKPALKVEFAITPAETEPARWRDCSDLVAFSGTHSTIARLNSLAPFVPGQYNLRLRISDKITHQTAAAIVPFVIER